MDHKSGLLENGKMDHNSIKPAEQQGEQNRVIEGGGRMKDIVQPDLPDLEDVFEILDWIGGLFK